jgi:3-oxoacyl-[acyl-carrier-protein] synthase I
MSASLTVVASGMVTALGYNAPSTLAAMRAGVSGLRSSAWADDESGEPVRCARVSLPQRRGGSALLADLVAPAIHECLAAAPVADVPLLIGVAHPERVGRPANLDDRLLSQIHTRLGITGHRESKIFAADEAGCGLALYQAQRLVESGRAQYVVVAGVDSFLDRATLDAFVERRRLLTPTNFNGFLPGEAGTAVLVAAASAAVGGLKIAGLGWAQETATIGDTKPLRGAGLTAAVKAALGNAGIGMADIAFRVTDLSGEHYKFKEAMFAAMRLDHSPREHPLDLWHPIEYLGQIGAAVLPCILAWTSHALHLGYAPGPHALCHIGSDDGQRWALVAHAA